MIKGGFDRRVVCHRGGCPVGAWDGYGCWWKGDDGGGCLGGTSSKLTELKAGGQCWTAAICFERLLSSSPCPLLYAGSAPGSGCGGLFVGRTAGLQECFQTSRHGCREIFVGMTAVAIVMATAHDMPVQAHRLVGTGPSGNKFYLLCTKNNIVEGLVCLKHQMFMLACVYNVGPAGGALTDVPGWVAILVDTFGFLVVGVTGRDRFWWLQRGWQVLKELTTEDLGVCRL
jgi:hypothetical protein